MSSNSRISVSKWIIVALALGFGASNANAQGQFSGTWRVTGAVTPDWIEHTSPPPVAPAKIGDLIEFGATYVRGNSPFSCKEVDFKILTLKSDEYFGGGISNSAEASKAATKFGLGGSAKTLRVDCETGVYDYHEGGGKLVVEFDNMVYTLERVKAE